MQKEAVAAALRSFRSSREPRRREPPPGAYAARARSMARTRWQLRVADAIVRLVDNRGGRGCGGCADDVAARIVTESRPAAVARPAQGSVLRGCILMCCAAGLFPF